MKTTTREVVRSRKKRLGAVAALIALIGSFMAYAISTAPVARADTSQSNGCLGVTGTFSAFNVPITGTATAVPGTVNPGFATAGSDTIHLTGAGVTIAVDGTLIGAGVTTGLVSAAPDLANIGVERINNPADGGTVPDVNGGVSAVTTQPGKVTLAVTGTNVTPSLQYLTNTGAVATTFYVTANVTDGTGVVVYTSVTNPGGGFDAGRTGTPLVGNLNVPIALDGTSNVAAGVAGQVITAGDSVWTQTTGTGSATFKEQNIAPANLTVPSGPDSAIAPLILLPKINGAINVPFHCWPGNIGAGATPPLVPGASSDISSIGLKAPDTAPVCATPQATSVGGGQTASPVVPNCTDVNGNFTASNTSIALVGVNGGAAHGTVTVNPSGSLTYSNDGLGASTDSFQYTATDTTALTSNTVTVNVAVLNNQCTASPSCNLKQVLVVPVAPSTLSMTETALGGPGNPTFSTAILGGVLSGTTCNPGPLQLNGQPQTVCGALNPITVINARGTDAQWDLTAQVTDFIDGTRGPLDTCSQGLTRNIDQSPKDNHCIPGDNLGWVPTGAISDPSVPGDTAAVTAGGIILPPNTTAQVPPAFPPSILAPRSNINSVTPPYSILNLSTPGPGLHDVAQALCGAPVNQSGGTFVCNAGLLLAVPGSAAAGTYTATITLTLA